MSGRISNFDYLMYLNREAGRSFKDLTQYPVRGASFQRRRKHIPGIAGRGTRDCMASSGTPG